MSITINSKIFLNSRNYGPQKNWFRILAIISGISVVDSHFLYLNSIKKDKTTIQSFNIRKFADFICHALSGTNHKPCYIFLRHRMGNNNHFIDNLVSIQDITLQTNRYPTDKQKNNHKTHSNPSKNNCFVFRKYLHRNENTQYNTTQWWCKLCKLSLFAVDCSKSPNNKEKYMLFLVEHKYTYDHNNYIY